MKNKIIASAPYLLALVFVLTSLRGVQPLHFRHDDSTHHALNGAFVYDMVRTGNLTHPAAYARQFYSRFPGITIPYHPPLFPFIEAVFYSVFGVTLFAARLPIALAAGACAFLMFRLIKATHQSDWLAFVATFSFMTLYTALLTASDVMLEFPALAFTLGALYCIHDLDKDYPWSRALPFALLASAAVWTKQHAVFLGLVPFLLILFRGSWRLLRAPQLWLSSVFFGLAVLALLGLSSQVHTAGVARQFASARTVGPAAFNTAWFYWRDTKFELGSVTEIWLVLSPAAFLLIPSLRRRRENDLYLAWILPLLLILLPAASHDMRYLLFGFPAFLVLGYDILGLACKRLLPAQYAPAVSGLVAIWLSVSQISLFLHERQSETAYTQIALALKDRSCRRFLYCGEKSWYLAATLRFVNPDSRAIMIRGDKLDPSIFTPDRVDRFAQRYGVDTLILEPGIESHPWDFLFVHPTAKMVSDRVVVGETSDHNKILIFDFANPSSNPESTIDVPLSFADGSLNLEL